MGRAKHIVIRVLVDDDLRRAMKNFNDSVSIRAIRTTLIRLLMADLEQLGVESRDAAGDEA